MSERSSRIDSRDQSLLRNGAISIRKILGRSVAQIGRHFGPILLAMVGPVAVMTIFLVLFPTGDPGSASVIWQAVISFLLWILLWVGFASVLHARFLDRRQSPPSWRVLIWSRAQVEFLFGIIKVTLLLIGIGIVVALASNIIGFVAQLIGTLAAMFVWARLAMVFPGASVGRPLALEDSWSLTSSGGWRVVVLLGVLYLASQALLPLALGLSLFFGSGWIGHAASAAVLFGGAAVVAAILSATYQALVETRPPDVRDTYIPQDETHLADAF